MPRRHALSQSLITFFVCCPTDGHSSLRARANVPHLRHGDCWGFNGCPRCVTGLPLHCLQWDGQPGGLGEREVRTLVQVMFIVMATTPVIIIPWALLCFFFGCRCNVIYGTPTMYIDMINHPDFDKYDLSSVREGEISLLFTLTFLYFW